MELKWTITAGELLQIVSFVVAIFAIYNRLSIEIAEIKTELGHVKKWWETCSNGDCPLARQVQVLSKEQRLERRYQVES